MSSRPLALYEYVAAVVTLHPPKSGYQSTMPFMEPAALVEFARRTAKVSAKFDGVPIHSTKQAAE